MPLESGPDLKTDRVTVETENMTSYPGGEWLGREVGEGFSRRMARLPARSDVDPRIQEIREQLIIEFAAR